MPTVNLRTVSFEEVVDLPVYPLADIFPMLAENAGGGDKRSDTVTLTELAESIINSGLQEPVVLYNGQLLDGRNRRAACKLAKVETIQVEDFEGTEEEADEYVLTLNVDRRDLSPGQRAFIAIDFWDYEAEKAKARQLSALKQNLTVSPNLDERSRTDEVLSERFRVSRGYIADARKHRKIIAEAEAIAANQSAEADRQRVIAENQKVEAEKAKIERDQAIADQNRAKEETSKARLADAAKAVNDANQAAAEAAEKAALKQNEARQKSNAVKAVQDGKKAMHSLSNKNPGQIIAPDDPDSELTVAQKHFTAAKQKMKESILEFHKVDPGDERLSVIIEALDSLKQTARETFEQWEENE